MRVISVLVALLTVLIISACRPTAPEPEEMKAAVVEALDSLVASLVAERLPDAAAYTEYLQTYLEEHTGFYGAAAALMDTNGVITASPYVYRSAAGLQTIDLARPEYRIEEQEWITMPLAAEDGVWTPPYFDAGGGEIWMITRSVPATDTGGVFAIITTDLPVDAPDQ